MAEKPKKKPVRRRRRQSSEGGGFLPLLMIALAAISIFQYEIAVLVAAGLLPTIVLSITGKGDHKAQKLQCVAFANIAGIMTMIPRVWERPSSMMETISDPMNLLIMWGGAVFGYALIYVGPQIASMILQGLAQDRLKNIAAQKQTLVEAWGHEVLGDKNEDTPQAGAFLNRPGSR